MSGMSIESTAYWAEREERIFATRNEAERDMAKAVGVGELTPLQVIQLRQACAVFERCEEGIERVQAQMEYWRSKGDKHVG